jgi:ABC-2 type transport system permease protein
MTPRITVAIAGRVLLQLRHDPRTVALLIVVPSLLVALLRYLLDGRPHAFDMLGPGLVGIFPLISMFLVSSITVLSERTTGTLERLLTMPLAKLDLLGGYALAFGAFAVVQAAVVSGVAFGLLGLDVQASPWAVGALAVGNAILGMALGAVAMVQAAVVSGVAFGLLGLDVQASPWAVGALAVGNAILGMALGLLVSAFASSEFQAVQFLPAFVLPQLLLCGLFVPRRQMAGVLDVASGALPLTYAYDSLHRVAVDGTLGGRGTLDLAVVAGSSVLALGLGAATLRRRTG